MILSLNGEQEEVDCFERGDKTEAWWSCGINWQNQLFIFGGKNEGRQISRLLGHKLERVGDLEFDHRWGACNVMNNQFVYLCFDFHDDYSRRCRKSNGPLEQFSDIELSLHSHRTIHIASSDG